MVHTSFEELSLVNIATVITVYVLHYLFDGCVGFNRAHSLLALLQKLTVGEFAISINRVLTYCTVRTCWSELTKLKR